MCPDKNETRMYTVGEVAEICHISKKTLRYYDQLGIISPDHIDPVNNYRYYSQQTVSSIAIIKYYKQMGFKLSEMHGLIDKPSYFYHENNFRTKIAELEQAEKNIQDELVQLRDWERLLHEAQIVKSQYAGTVSIKCLEEQTYCALEQDFHYDYCDSILNIPWTNYLQEHHQEITGPVVLRFGSYADKRDGTIQRATIMQRPVPSPFATKQPDIVTFGGFFASYYHIGAICNIADSYTQLLAWAREHGYSCGPECYERYVVDYWTSTDPDDYVTEILVPITKKDAFK